MAEEKQKIGDDIDLTKQDKVILHPSLEKNEYPAEALKNPPNRSLLAKFLSEELFNKLKDKKSPQGFTLARAINTGVKNPQSLVGIHAGDIEAWETFAEIYDPVIEAYHGGYKADAKHPSDPMDSSQLKGDIEDPSPILTTRIRVARNIAGFNLAPGQNSVEEKLEIEKVMVKVFDSIEDEELKGTYYPLDGMKEEDRQRLIADHFLFKGNDIMQADSGYHRWFPKGRGIFHNKDKTFLSWINEGDHVRIISMQKGGDVRAVFDRLARGVKAISDGIKKVTGNKEAFMKNDHLGHVCCCPTNLGTGLRGGVHIKLPKLAAKGVDELSEIAAKHHIQARGIHGEHSKSEGGIVDLSNKYRLGYSEVQLVQFMIDGVNAMVKLEKELN